MTRRSSTVCPWCNKKHDLVSGVVEKTAAPPQQEPVPKDGDASLCFGCGMISIFAAAARGGLRFPDHKEWVELRGEKLMVDVMTAFAMVTKNNSQTLRTILHKPDWMT